MNFTNRVRTGASPARLDAFALAENLRESLRNASSTLGSSVPPSLRAEFEDVLREQDPQLLVEGLQSLARRAGAQDQIQFAASIYHAMAEAPGVPEELRLLANRGFEALQGGGSFGERSEFFLRHFLRQASDPKLLLGMACGGVVYRTVRGLALGELAAGTSLGTTGLRFWAGAAGFAAEAPSFVLASRGIRAVLGESAPAGSPSLEQEILSSYLFLGAIRGTGAASQWALRWWLGPATRLTPLANFSTGLFSQAGMLGGILLSHRAETALGLRPNQDSASLLAESLATLLQFHVSGRIFQQLAGPGFQSWESAMDRQAELVSLRPRRPLQPWQPAFAGLGGPMLMASLDPEECGPGPGAIGDSWTFEGKGMPRLQVEAKEGVGRTLRRFSDLSKEHGTALRVDLPPGFASRISDWGYQWQESMRRNYWKDFRLLQGLHGKIANGASLEEMEIAFLRTLQGQAQADFRDFATQKDLLSRLAERSRFGRTPNPASDQALDRVIHDLSHRPYFLQILDLSAADLLQGQALSPLYLDSIEARGGFSIAKVLREGVWRAASDSPEFAERLWKSLSPEDFVDLRLSQGGRAAKGLSDILANLLSNAWRYRRDEAGPVVLGPELLANGSLQISVRDQGMGISSENIARLGMHGYREARREVAGSQGLGLNSVIETLRRLGWGPLWVRSQVGQGTEFRFSIPRGHLELTGSKLPDLEPIDLWGQGENTEMELNLEAGFRVPVNSLDLAVRQIMHEVPLSVLVHDHHPEGISTHEALRRGALRHRRLEMLHRLLAGTRELNGLQVVENGPGFTIEMTHSLLGLGAEVRVKEPDPASRRFHYRHLGKVLEGEPLTRVTYTPPTGDLDTVTPAHIVYWANPFEHDMLGFSPGALANYLGRDVAPGGFLVLQTDHHFDTQTAFLKLPLDPQHWERVFNQELPDYRYATNQFLPTSQGHSLRLQIYYRRP